jgi:transposase
LLMARRVVEGAALNVPNEAAQIVLTLSQQALATHLKIRDMERQLQRWHRSNEMSQRLATIPGVGPIGASALVASVADPHQFQSGRQFAAWLGLTPLQNSSGGKERLGRISKMGDRYLRKLLFVGAMSMVRRARYKPDIVDPRLADLLARKPIRLAAIALANKTARIIWAIMTRGESYRTGHVPALAA